MKSFKLILLIIIPIAVLACNDGTNRNKEKNNNQNRENDMNRSDPDTISQGSFFYKH